MSPRYEWTTTKDAHPMVLLKDHAPDGEYVEPVPGDPFREDDVVTQDYAIVMGDGMVIEGSAADLEALFLSCARMIAAYKED